MITGSMMKHMTAIGSVRVRRDNGWRVERYPQTVAGVKDEQPDVRNRVVRAAVELALQGGLESVGIERAAQQAAVPPEALLHQFGNHDGLMLAVLDFVLARTLDADRDLRAGEGPRQLGEMVAAEMEGLRRQAPVVELIFMFYFARRDDLYRGRIRDALANYRRSFESALDGVVLRRGVDATVMSSIVIAFLQGAAVQIIRDPDNFQPAAAIAEMRAMLGS